MKGILFLNGEQFSGKINTTDSYVVCCDGAYEWVRGKVKINENIGDFDSLGYVPYPEPVVKYTAEKDLTDGEIGMRRLIKLGCKNIEVYGGNGGREDHFIGNLHLLYYAHTHKCRAVMISESSLIFIGSGKVEFRKQVGKTVSVLPFGGALNIINSTGLKYPEPPVLNYGECRGVSNVVTGDPASITFAAGSCALIIINRGKV